MGFSFDLDRSELAEAARPGLRRIAREIGNRAAPRFRFSRHKDPSNMVVEDLPDGGVRVGMDRRFGWAHLDEWGGSKSRPSGALRSAAAEFGEFTPEPKPT